MAGGEDQPQQLIADVVVQGGIQIGHGLLLGLHLPRDHAVFAVQHRAAAQMIQRPAFGGRHQPGAGRPAAKDDARVRRQDYAFTFGQP